MGSVSSTVSRRMTIAPYPGGRRTSVHPGMALGRRRSYMERNYRTSFSADDLDRSMMEELEMVYYTQKKPYMFNPVEPARARWDRFILVALIFIGLQVPYHIAFGDDADLGWNFVMRLVVDLSFLIDIAINFRTGFFRYSKSRDEEILVMDSEEVARHYLRGYFRLDVLAVIDIALGLAIPRFRLSGIGIAIAFLPVLKVFRIVHAMRTRTRMQRHPELAKAGETSTGSSARDNSWQILQQLSLFVLTAHYVGCFFFWIGHSQPADAGGRRSWIEVEGIQSLPRMSQYITSMYWATTTLLTVGYGDIVPQTDMERAYGIAVCLVGAVMYAMVFGSVTVLLQNLDANQSRYHSRMADVRQFLAHYKDELSEEQAAKMLRYNNYLWDLHHGYNVEDMLGELPLHVRSEIKLALVKGLLSKVPLFKHCEETFIKSIVMQLRPQVCLAGDYIFGIGDLGNEMYFLRRGTLEVLSTNDDGVESVVALLKPGSTFGEIALFGSGSRTAGIRAKTKSEYYSLSREAFEGVLTHFPEYKDRLMQTAVRRLRRDVDRQTRSPGLFFQRRTSRQFKIFSKTLEVMNRSLPASRRLSSASIPEEGAEVTDTRTVRYRLPAAAKRMTRRTLHGSLAPPDGDETDDDDDSRSAAGRRELAASRKVVRRVEEEAAEALGMRKARALAAEMALEAEAAAAEEAELEDRPVGAGTLAVRRRPSITPTLAGIEEEEGTTADAMADAALDEELALFARARADSGGDAEATEEHATAGAAAAARVAAAAAAAAAAGREGEDHADWDVDALTAELES